MEDDKLTRIKAAFAREQISKPMARDAADIPVSYEAITPEWLTAILCRDVAGAAVTAFRLDVPDSGTSNRRRIFLEYNATGANAGLPASVFCKATHALENRILLSTAGIESEVRFYNEIRPMLAIDAPQAFFAGYDPESYASIIVLRDMAGEVEFCSHRTPMGREAVESQLDLLATMHGTFYESDLFRTRLANTIRFCERFHLLDQRNGIGIACANGFRAAEPVIPVRLAARGDDIWPATVRAVDRHATLPDTLTHNDVHLKNWYLRERSGARPSMGLGDWQVSCRGHWSRDLAYAIATALEPEDRRALERDLVAYYLDRLAAAGGPRVLFEEAWRHYREQMLSALAWWTMTLAPRPEMPDMQPEDTTLEFIRRLAVAIDDLNSLDVA